MRKPGHKRLGRLGVVIGVALILPLALFGLGLAVTPSPVPLLAPQTAGSLMIEDERGELIFQAASDLGGREQWTALKDISSYLIDGTIAAEDHRFYQHGGVDPLGVVRAAWLNISKGSVAFGGSTIPMQLARLIAPSVCRRSLVGKIRQALLAWKIEKLLSKKEILEQYFNRAYYGNGAFGAAQAARMYFDKSAAALSPGESAMLAVFPRGPSLYNPYHFAGLQKAIERQRRILSRMVELGVITRQALELALAMPAQIGKKRTKLRAPHFVDYIISRIPKSDLAGASLETGFDLILQERLEVAVKRHIAAVGSRGVNQAGVVVIRNSDGAIMAMVGSADYYDWNKDGAANVLTLPRRPGSTLKPFVYGLALEAGDSPATIAYDVVLPGEFHESWAVEVKQHGFARYRESLAGSYNLAAVHTLQKVGVEPLLARLRAAGLSNLDWDDREYDYTLAVGEAEYTVLEYAGAFATFGTGGRPVTPRAVLSIAKPQGNKVESSSQHERAAIFSPEVAYQIFDILSDQDARRPMFGAQSPMVLPFKVALKTGTTRAYTDNLAFGTTAEYTVGAWAGNFDGTPTETLMAMQGAAPLVRAAFVNIAALHGDPSAPPKPKDLQYSVVCPLSGKAPGPHCPARKSELFADHQLQPSLGDLCRVHAHACGQSYLNFPPELKGWARAHGILDEPDCEIQGQKNQLRIVSPPQNAVFLLDPHRPLEHQVPPLRVMPDNTNVSWYIDGKPVQEFVPSVGQHRAEARLGGLRTQVTFQMN